jgi:hypothetical protein
MARWTGGWLCFFFLARRVYGPGGAGVRARGVRASAAAGWLPRRAAAGAHHHVAGLLRGSWSRGTPTTEQTNLAPRLRRTRAARVSSPGRGAVFVWRLAMGSGSLTDARARAQTCTKSLASVWSHGEVEQGPACAHIYQPKLTLC